MKKFLIRASAALVFAALASGAAQAQVSSKKSLNLEGARKVIAAALAEARRLNAPGGVVAVVDDGGNLVALERMDGTFTAGANAFKAPAAASAAEGHSVSYFDAKDVKAAFDRGAVLFDGGGASNYMVHASRR